MNVIARKMAEIREIEEKYQKIQENPALYGAENGFTSEELKLFEPRIELCGEGNLAGKEIARRAKGNP